MLNIKAMRPKLRREMEYIYISSFPMLEKFLKQHKIDITKLAKKLEKKMYGENWFGTGYNLLNVEIPVNKINEDVIIDLIAGATIIYKNTIIRMADLGYLQTLHFIKWLASMLKKSKNR